jgi:NTE family protein
MRSGSSSEETEGPTRVAIACQGGGSHTAFTAGVLQELLPAIDASEDHRLVGLSGTSGGAMCAALAWYGEVHPDEEPGDLLTEFWADLAARSPADRFGNDMVRLDTQFRRMGFPTTETSPTHSPGSAMAKAALQRTLERHVDFEAIPDLLDGSEPVLLISAIEVLTGEFEIFRETDLRPEMLLASAAEPHLFSAVEVDGGYYWDGLFSKNPPVQDFSLIDDVDGPDEVWLIKINPQERPRVPKTIDAIDERRNELSGNVSMNAEVRFMKRVNQWIEKGYLPDRYTHTEIKRIRFQRTDLDWRTKLDRSPAFIEGLIRDGEEAADAFLDER